MRPEKQKLHLAIALVLNKIKTFTIFVSSSLWSLGFWTLTYTMAYSSATFQTFLLLLKARWENIPFFSFFFSNVQKLAEVVYSRIFRVELLAKAKPLNADHANAIASCPIIFTLHVQCRTYIRYTYTCEPYHSPHIEIFYHQIHISTAARLKIQLRLLYVSYKYTHVWTYII